MQQLATLSPSTTSSQDTFLHLWVLNFPTCPTALQLCPSAGLIKEMLGTERMITVQDATGGFACRMWTIWTNLDYFGLAWA